MGRATSTAFEELSCRGYYIQPGLVLTRLLFCQIRGERRKVIENKEMDAQVKETRSGKSAPKYDDEDVVTGVLK